MGKYVVPLTVVFGTIIIGGALMFYYWLVPKIRESVQMVNQNMSAIYVENTEKYKDQFLLDEREIKKLAVFSKDYLREGKDAATFLNPALSKVSQKDESSILAIPRQVSNALVIEGEQWMSQKVANHIQGLSDSWLDELQKYGYWSEEKLSDYESNLKKDPLYNFFESPVEPPPLLHLYYWAQISWLKSIYEKAPSPQAKLRQLVKLLHSRGTLESTLLAIKILSLEVEVGDFHPELVTGKKLNQLDLGRLTRFAYAASSILRTAIFSPQNYELYDQLEVGRCLAVEGSMPYFFMLYKPLFNQPWYAHYLRMTDYIKSEKCSRRRFQSVWGNDEFTIRYMKGKDLGAMVQKHFNIKEKSEDYAFQSIDQQVNGQDIFELSQVKIVSRIFATSLMSINSPDPWEYYHPQ